MTNVQSTVNRPQVEADCGKEEVRNLLWTEQGPQSPGSDYGSNDWRACNSRGIWVCPTHLPGQVPLQGLSGMRLSGHIKETSRQVELWADGRRWHKMTQEEMRPTGASGWALVHWQRVREMERSQNRADKWYHLLTSAGMLHHDTCGEQTLTLAFLLISSEIVASYGLRQLERCIQTGKNRKKEEEKCSGKGECRHLAAQVSLTYNGAEDSLWLNCL